MRRRPLRIEDAEQSSTDGVDSLSRQRLQLGIQLPNFVELLKSSLEKHGGCKGAEGVILFVIETLEGVNVGGISFHSRDEKDGRFSFGSGPADRAAISVCPVVAGDGSLRWPGFEGQVCLGPALGALDQEIAEA